MHIGGQQKLKKGDYPLWISPDTKRESFELDEIFWFIGKRKGFENGVNTYIMTMLSREPRQILGFSVDDCVSAERIQDIVDKAPQADKYYTDGGTCYLGVDFIGKHCRNIRDKRDTHNIEGSNADIRHYIAGLQRKSRCFFRKRETLEAVLSIFVFAFNHLGAFKAYWRQKYPQCGRNYPVNHLQFI